MAQNRQVYILILLLQFFLKTKTINAHAIGEVHSDVVVTKFGPDDDSYLESKDNEEEPGWMVGD